MKNSLSPIDSEQASITPRAAAKKTRPAEAWASSSAIAAGIAGTSG